MSDLEDSFLQKIAHQPHDWLPRLIFADWLEEQGDPRGELIQLSHQLTQLDCEDRQSKESRLQELAAAGVVWPSPSLPNSPQLRLVLIPPGQFRMGSPDSEPGRVSDENQVDVTLSRGFWLGQYAVTEAEWEQVMGFPAGNPFLKPPGADRSQHPANGVRLDHADAFCSMLTSQERDAGRLPADWEYTLPTEAQWEYACRAGTTTATAVGDTLDSTQANFNGNQPYNGAGAGKFIDQTTVVGSYPPNAWNLYDMHGNVWEWCRDKYNDQLPGGTDPLGENRDAYMVFRGGSKSDNGSSCRSAARRWGRYDHSSLDLGFRLAAVQAR